MNFIAIGKCPFELLCGCILESKTDSALAMAYGKTTLEFTLCPYHRSNYLIFIDNINTK
jgi:hypothetical protein